MARQTNPIHYCVAAADSRTWRLQAKEVNGDERRTLQLPIKADELDAIVAEELGPGRWDLELVPTHPSAHGRTAGKAKMREIGKVRQRFTVETQDLDGDNAELVSADPATRAPARGNGVPRPLSDLEKKREELEIRKVDLELEKLRGGGSTESAAALGAPPWAQELIRRMDRLEDRDRDRDRERPSSGIELLIPVFTQMLEHRAAEAPAPSGPSVLEMAQVLQASAPGAAAPAAETSPIAAMGGFIPVLEMILKAAKLLGLRTGDDAGGGEMGQIGEVAKLLEAVTNASGKPSDPAARGVKAPPAGPRQKLPVREEMRRRVVSFVDTVMREMIGASDPVAVGHQCAEGLPMLPLPFRSLLLGSSAARQVVGGLGPWIGPAQVQALQGQVAIPENEAWLEAWLEELRASDEEQHEDLPDPDAVTDERYDRAVQTLENEDPFEEHRDAESASEPETGGGSEQLPDSVSPFDEPTVGEQ